MWFHRAAGQGRRRGRTLSDDVRRSFPAGVGDESSGRPGRRQLSRRRGGESGALTVSEEADSPPESPPESTLANVGCRRAPAGRLDAVRAERELTAERELANEPTDSGIVSAHGLHAHSVVTCMYGVMQMSDGKMLATPLRLR